MVIYPVPAAVTQAKIQLVIDETAKAPMRRSSTATCRRSSTAQRQAEQEALVDVKA